MRFDKFRLLRYKEVRTVYMAYGSLLQLAMSPNYVEKALLPTRLEGPSGFIGVVRCAANYLIIRKTENVYIKSLI